MCSQLIDLQVQYSCLDCVVWLTRPRAGGYKATDRRVAYMFSRLMPKEYGFFELFKRHARTCYEGSQALVEATRIWPAESESRVLQIKQFEHECDSITHMTVDLLHRTFITPLDRNEILNLISKMDDVMDCIELAASRMHRFKISDIPKKMQEMTQVLCRAAEQLVAVVDELKGFRHVEELRERFKEIHRLENEGDELVHAGVAQVFEEFAADPIMVMKLKEIYEIIERGIDECEDVANIVEGILLEHS